MQGQVHESKRAAYLPRGWLGRAALALLLLVFLAGATQPLWLGPVLGRSLTQASGRSVVIDSARLGLTQDFEPVLRCDGIRIQNAPWADSPKPFARLGEFIAVLSWKSLLQPRAVISLMVLRDGEVDLEREADGLRNWRLRDPDNRGPGRYKVLALQAERTSLRVRHAAIGLVLEARSSPNPEAAAPAAAAGSGVLTTRLDFTGQWRAVPFESRVATGPVLSFYETGSLFPLRGWLKAGGATLEVDGQAGDIFREPLLDAQLSLAGDSLAPFSSFIGARFSASPRREFGVAGRLQASDHAFALSSMKARIGASDVAGELEIERRPAGPRHALQARLRSELLDAADLRWLAGPQAPAAAASAVAAGARAAPEPAGSAPAASKDDGRPAFARRYDAKLELGVARMRVAEAPWLRSLAVEAALADGIVRVAKADFGVLKGRATGHGELDLRPVPPTTTAELAVDGVRIEELMAPGSASKRITGSLQARASVQASGASARALLASASGTASARLTGGTISSVLDAEIGLQGGKIVRSLLGGSEALAVRCATAAVELQAGKGNVRTLVFDTERTRSTGTGRFDLSAETIDLVLTPEAKQGGLFVLDRSIRLHGPLRKPERELIARAAPAAGRACPA